jgi:hypothetical protein
MTPTRALMDAELGRRTAHADALVGWRLADARAHAQIGDLPTARQRLYGLQGELVGKLKDARGHFYKKSFAYHRANGLDPAVHDMGLQPTPEGEEVARDAKIFDRWLEVELRDITRDSAAALTSVALAANDSRTPEHAASALWSGWQTEQHRRFGGRAKQDLSDAQVALYEAVGRMFVLPNLR